MIYYTLVNGVPDYMNKVRDRQLKLDQCLFVWNLSHLQGLGLKAANKEIFIVKDLFTAAELETRGLYEKP
jgi:hypothetical protein